MEPYGHIITGQGGPPDRCNKRYLSGRQVVVASGPPWRPAIGLGARSAHEHGPLGVIQAVRVQKWLNRLLIVDDCERAGPVRAPQAAIEAPGVEHAGKRVPNVRKGVRLVRQRAGTTDLDYGVW